MKFAQSIGLLVPITLLACGIVMGSEAKAETLILKCKALTYWHGQSEDSPLTYNGASGPVRTFIVDLSEKTVDEKPAIISQTSIFFVRSSYPTGRFDIDRISKEYTFRRGEGNPQ